MRLSAITFAATVTLATTCLLGLGLATAQSAPERAPAPAAAPADPTATPEISARLVRLGADIKGGIRQGWLSQQRADQLSDQVRAMRILVAKKTKDGGQLSERDLRRMDAQVADLHREMGDIAAAARGRRRG